MAVIYKPFQSSFKNKAGLKLFYPRVVQTRNVSTEAIAREIAGYSSLSSGDVKNTIDNLVTVMSQHLQSSESVTLDGFGSFRITMKSGGKGVEKEKDVSASQAKMQIRFLPAYTRNPNRSIATRSLVTGVKCVRFDLVDQTGGGEVPGSGDSGNNGSGDGKDDNPLG